ncbi:MAG: hypothetical protein GX556_08515 [Fibrobacter sp.]|nr:hypothetical protein [Fibrobacter sp.]
MLCFGAHSCPIHCVKKILESAGVSGFTHLVMRDLGIKKGDTPVMQEEIERITEIIRLQYIEKMNSEISA